MGFCRVLVGALMALSLGVAHGGTVVLYAATDRDVVEPLIRDFEILHPTVRVEYHDLNSGEMYRRFLDELGSERQADVLWSSAMHLQFKLVNDGYAAPYKSTQTAALPTWAVWKGEAFGTTFEPVVFAYNKKRVRAADVPRTHADLVRFARHAPTGRLATYDPRESGLGYLLHTQDLEANPVVFWDLARASAGAVLEAATADILRRLSEGRAVMAYNVLGSYALAEARRNPALGIVLPSDYTLILSRIAFINRQAPHPAEARLWMDYLLSRRGQAVLNATGLFSVREDVSTSDSSASELRKQLGSAYRPIVISTGLLTYLDRQKREHFLARWDAAMTQRASAPTTPAATPPEVRSPDRRGAR